MPFARCGRITFHSWQIGTTIFFQNHTTHGIYQKIFDMYITIVVKSNIYFQCTMRGSEVPILQELGHELNYVTTEIGIFIHRRPQGHIFYNSLWCYGMCCVVLLLTLCCRITLMYYSVCSLKAYSFVERIIWFEQLLKFQFLQKGPIYLILPSKRGSGRTVILFNDMNSIFNDNYNRLSSNCIKKVLW